MLTAQPAEAGALCTWFGHCVYESRGFRITVVDGETRRPLADVHALAEWQSYAGGRRNGPLMAQDATSGADGALTFPAWGPVAGSREGLALNSDPVITLFKSGYGLLVINNAFPVGADETDRVRPLRQDGATFALERFRGTTAESVDQLATLAYGLALPRRPEDTRRLRAPYLGRLQRVRAELRTLPQDARAVEDLLLAVERSIQSLEGAPE